MQNQGKDDVWTPSERETLLTMYAAKVSAAEIAATLNRSEAGVKAKYYRMNDNVKRHGTTHGVDRRKTGHYGHMVVNVNRRRDNPVVLDSADVTRFEALPLPPGALSIPLLELTAGTCRYSVGTSKLFCGAPIEEGFPYCRYHCNIAYVRKT